LISATSSDAFSLPFWQRAKASDGTNRGAIPCPSSYERASLIYAP